VLFKTAWRVTTLVLATPPLPPLLEPPRALDCQPHEPLSGPRKLGMERVPWPARILPRGLGGCPHPHSDLRLTRLLLGAIELLRPALRRELEKSFFGNLNALEEPITDGSKPVLLDDRIKDEERTAETVVPSLDLEAVEWISLELAPQVNDSPPIVAPHRRPTLLQERCQLGRGRTFPGYVKLSEKARHERAIRGVAHTSSDHFSSAFKRELPERPGHR
jgi:hypothetical protein